MTINVAGSVESTLSKILSRTVTNVRNKKFGNHKDRQVELVII